MPALASVLAVSSNWQYNPQSKLSKKQVFIHMFPAESQQWLGCSTSQRCQKKVVPSEQTHRNDP